MSVRHHLHRSLPILRRKKFALKRKKKVTSAQREGLISLHLSSKLRYLNRPKSQLRRESKCSPTMRSHRYLIRQMVHCSYNLCELHQIESSSSSNSRSSSSSDCVTIGGKSSSSSSPNSPLSSGRGTLPSESVSKLYLSPPI